MVPDASLLEAVLEASPDIVLLVDHQGCIRRCFGPVARILGYTPEELVGQGIEVLVPLGQRAHHVHLREGFERHANQRPMGSGLMVEGLCKDGGRVALDVQLVPLQLDGEALTIAVARDVRHIVRLHEETARYAAQEAATAARLQVALGELSQRTVALEALNDEKNRILGIAAHDLRNPLTALRAFNDLLAAGVLGELEPRAAGMLGRVQRSVDYMARLVDGMVDFSAIEAGRLDMHLELIDIRELVEGTVGIERLAASRRAVTLITDCAPDVGRAHVDPGKLEQVLHNLVGNAIRYTPDGGEVRVQVRRQGERILLQVDDQGPGLDDEELPHIFEPFFRGDRPGVLGEKSVGLGLAIVRRIIEGHGGSIAVANGDGGGACFTVQLPV